MPQTSRHLLLVISPYYMDVAGLLLDGAKRAIEHAGATYDIIETPGALEIPPAIKHVSNAGKYDAYVALGCIIRGKTSHYDIVSNESARGLSTLGLEHGLPIGNGILTCDTLAQAIVRADPAQKNKGADAVNAALCLLKLKNKYQVK